jgi:hypothetical protein
MIKLIFHRNNILELSVENVCVCIYIYIYMFIPFLSIFLNYLIYLF